MNTTPRIGKIGRLPHSIREQLNLKLLDGLPAKKILPWLNSLLETKAITAEHFDNHPISKQNLSEWKQGGHRDWLLQYHAAHFLLDSSSFSSSSSSSVPSSAPISESSIQHPASAPQPPTFSSASLTHKLLLWTQLQYISMARHIDAETDPKLKWNALHQFSNDISRLRHSSLADDYLQIQRDWLALSQSNTADKKEKEFWEWTERPDIHKKLFPDKRPGLSPEALYEMETKFCLMGDGPGPETAELMAEVRIAKKLLEMRKAKEAEARAKADPEYDPNRPLPDTRVRLAGMPFEELFPTIPEKPLTETHPELDDDVEDSDDADASGIGGAGVPASRQDAAQDRSPAHTTTGDVNVGRERQAQVALPTAPPHQAPSAPEHEAVGPVPSPGAVDSHGEFPLPKGEGQDEGEGTDLPPTTPAPSSAQSVDNPLSQTESNPVQPNPTTPPPDPDVTM